MGREAASAGRLDAAVALAGGDPEMVRGEHVTEAANAVFAAEPNQRGARAAAYNDEWLRFEWRPVATAPEAAIDSPRPWPLA